MTLNLRLAWRNLWRHARRTWLTATAMIFSNVLLVFMISLQLGSYDMMIDNTLRAFSGHLQVQRQGYRQNPKLRDSIAAIGPLTERIRRALPSARVTARAAGFALVSSEDRSFGAQVIGVQPAFEGGVSSLPGLVTEGRYLDDPNAPEIVVGSAMARNLKVKPGDELTLLGSGRDGSLAAGVLTVVGIFDSGNRDMDRGFAEIPLGYFQEMYAMGDHGHSIAAAINNLDELQPALAAVRAVVAGADDVAVLDWNQLHPGLRQAIQADFSSAWFMYAVLIVLVAFSVLNTQLMSVLERTREFGVITALGVKPRKLASLVMLETTLMSTLGLVLGVLLGGLVSLYFNTTGFTYPGMQEFTERFNMDPVMYPSFTALSLLLGPLVVFAFCLLASVYPALRLYRLHPVEAMRAV